MKLLKYIGLSFLGLSLNSCTDYLDNAPDDTLTMEMVFNDKTRTEDWLSGVYNRVPDPYWSLLRDYGYDSMGDDLDPSQRWYQWWGNTLNFVIGQWFTMKDECRFLIAYYYWMMIEAYGSVPFFDGLADVNDPNLMRGQIPFDEMVDWIDGQLVSLSKKLPTSWLSESTQFYGQMPARN